jgi:carboxypeptidase C (cathepsin A)
VHAAGKRILIYNGSSDSVCNGLGNMRTVHGAFAGVPVTRRRAPWFVDHQVAGYTEHFDDGKIVTASVRAAGHMVPQYTPGRALAMIARFVNGTL